MKHIISLFTFFIVSNTCISSITKPVYICTASDNQYFPCLINLIGSLQKDNFDDISQIAVFNLGLNQQQIDFLSSIEKVALYSIEQTHPDLLKRFNTRTWGKPVPGWYAWKPVIIKQAFDLFGQDSIVFWIDSGTTILRNILGLFEYVQEHGYFLHNGSPWPINKESTEFVKQAFNLYTPENNWILSNTIQGLEAGFMGVTIQVYDTFIKPMYELTKDMRYFADDGSCPGGFGNSRHDLTLFSIHALLNGYKIHQHWEHPKELLSLEVEGNAIPFHIACNPEDRIPETNIYCARFDVNPNEYIQYIHFK